MVGWFNFACLSIYRGNIQRRHLIFSNPCLPDLAEGDPAPHSQNSLILLKFIDLHLVTKKYNEQEISLIVQIVPNPQDCPTTKFLPYCLLDPPPPLPTLYYQTV